MFLIGFCSVCAQVYFVFVSLFVSLALLNFDHCDPPKNDQTGLRNRSDSGAKFGAILGSDLASFWLHFSSLWGTPNPSQSGSRDLVGAPWRSQVWSWQSE